MHQGETWTAPSHKTTVSLEKYRCPCPTHSPYPRLEEKQLQQLNHQQSVPTITENDCTDPELLPRQRLTPQEPVSYTHLTLPTSVYV